MDGRGRHGNHRRGPKTAGVVITCEVCGRERRYMPSQLRVRKVIRFCSIQCRNRGAVKNLVDVACVQCGATTTKRKDHLRTRRNAFCSPACAHAARRCPGARWKNPEAIKDYMRSYAERNRGRLNEQARLWAKANRIKKTAASQRWRARCKQASIGDVDYDRIMERDRMTCHICGQMVNRKDLHFDHVIPLSKGGAHSEANIAVSHGRCNVRKGNRLYGTIR